MTPRGIRNNNPLNIRRGSNWKGLRPEQKDKAFCQFVSMQYGVRAGFYLLRRYLSGYEGKCNPIDTITKIISKWAPPSENKTIAYIRTVSLHSGINEDEKLQFRDRKKMVSIVEAMINVECGQSISREIIESAYDML